MRTNRWTTEHYFLRYHQTLRIVPWDLPVFILIANNMVVYLFPFPPQVCSLKTKVPHIPMYLLNTSFQLLQGESSRGAHAWCYPGTKT